MPSREAVCTIFWWYLVWPSWEANPWPTMWLWEANTLTTKSSRLTFASLSDRYILNRFHHGQFTTFMYVSHWLYNQLVKDVCNHRLDVTAKPARKEYCFISGFVRIDYPLQCFLGIKGHVTLDRNAGPGYTSLILCMIL